MAPSNILKSYRMRTGTQDSRAPSLTVRDIPIGDIRIKENIRKDYTEIDDLASSIKQHGLLQPIMVYHDGGGFAVKTGHRRFMAFQKLYQEEPDRFKEIRCIITDSDNIAVIQLIENVQQVGLNAKELSDALISLRDQGFTHKQIADMMGKSEGHVKNLFMAVKEVGKDAEFKDYLESHGAVTFQDIIETKGMKDKEARLDLIEQRVKGEISQKTLREEAAKLKGGKKAAAKKSFVKDNQHEAEDFEGEKAMTYPYYIINCNLKIDEDARKADFILVSNGLSPHDALLSRIKETIQGYFVELQFAVEENPLLSMDKNGLSGKNQ